MGVKMAKNERPPLGVKPYYIAASERIEDLADAIKRYAPNCDTEYEKISQWAEEIKMQCAIAKKFDK
jgi:hypothetical protein